MPRQPDELPSRTLRVLHIVNGEHYAGAERVQDLLAAELPNVGVEVALACVKPGRFGSMRQSQSTRLVEAPMRSRFDLRPAWQLAKLVRGEKFDLIHTHTPRSTLVGHLAARLAGVPMVHHVHGHTATEVGQTFRARLNAKIEKHSLSRAAAVIAVSATAAKYIRDWGIPDERVHLVPNGVPAREKLGASAYAFDRVDDWGDRAVSPAQGTGSAIGSDGEAQSREFSGAVSHRWRI